MNVLSFTPIFLLILVMFSVNGYDNIDLNGEWIAVNSNGSIQVFANVPGGIYTDLYSNNIIDDPYYRFNDLNYRWVAKDQWNYSRQFEVSSDFIYNDNIKLICEGIDTVAEIFVNEQLIGSTNNMFVRYSFDIKQFLQVGTNTISVSFTSPIEFAKAEYEKHLVEKYVVPPICPPPVQNGECHPNFIRKIQSQFSWDWGPAFPSMGIWKNIKIEAFSTLIRNIMVETVPESGLKSTVSWEVNLKIILETDSNQSRDGLLTAQLKADNLYFEHNTSITVIPNANNEAIVNVTFIIPKSVGIKRWWPNGLGDQSLYLLKITFIDSASGEQTDKIIHVGFRTVELVQEPIVNVTGLSFYFKVNDIAVFMKGSNWIPADSFPERVTDKYTELLLQSAKDAHMNVLRVWGGGMYETDNFYKLADEMGIMIWQDMMFACAMYPATDKFLSTIIPEIVQQVQRLQHHPSILIWSGNNENEAALVGNWYFTKDHFETYKADYLKLYVDTIKVLINELDSSRSYLISSPSNGIESEKEGGIATDPYSNLYGDVHFYDYGKDSWNWTIYPRSRFVSEYGFQSWPSYETLKSISSEGDWDYYSEFMNHRQHHALGNFEILIGVARHMKWFSSSNTVSATDLKTYQSVLYLTQIYQAMSIKAESEFYLRSQSEIINNEGQTMGALYWQLNDIWQGPSWASIEYGGKWKMLHYFATQFFAPQLVSPYEQSGNLIIYYVSDPFVKTQTMILSLFVYKWDSLNPIYSSNQTISELSQRSQNIYQVPMKELLDAAQCPGRQFCFLYFMLTDKDTNKITSTNFLLLSTFVAAQGIKKPYLKATVSSNIDESSNSTYYSIELTTKAIAPFVWLEATGIKGRFSDNGFLLVNPTVTIKFYPWQNTSEQELHSQLSLLSLEDTI